MQEKINYKFNPGVANQSPTRRRISIANSMRSDGEKLQKVQNILNNLSELWKTGNLPHHHRNIKSKIIIEDILCYDEFPRRNDDFINRLHKAGIYNNNEYLIVRN